MQDGRDNNTLDGSCCPYCNRLTNIWGNFKMTDQEKIKSQASEIIDLKDYANEALANADDASLLIGVLNHELDTFEEELNSCHAKPTPASIGEVYRFLNEGFETWRVLISKAADSVKESKSILDKAER